jgi:hypothetical protein
MHMLLINIDSLDHLEQRGWASTQDGVAKPLFLKENYGFRDRA